MVKVKMLKSTKGSPNGISVIMYAKGGVYDIPEELFNSFVSMGVVDLVEEKQEQKMVDSYENKSFKSPNENKDVPRRGRKRKEK